MIALAAPHASGVPVEVDVAAAQATGDPLRAASPEQSMHARDQFGNGEGLDDIVVRPDHETAHALRLLAARRHHDHGQRAGILPRAQPAADLQPRHAGKHPVENDEIGRIFRQPKLGLVAPLDAVHDVALGLEIVGEQYRKVRLVLDHENARSRRRVAADVLPARLVHASPPAASTSMSVSCRPRGRSEGIGSPVTR